MGNNDLNGTMPRFDGLLPNLQYLDLSSSDFNGTMPGIQQLASITVSRWEASPCGDVSVTSLYLTNHSLL
jgi:hypothetical protein